MLTLSARCSLSQDINSAQDRHSLEMEDLKRMRAANADVAASRDRYTAKADALQEQLAAVTATLNGKTTLVATLQARLDAADEASHAAASSARAALEDTCHARDKQIRALKHALAEKAREADELARDRSDLSRRFDGLVTEHASRSVDLQTSSFRSVAESGELERLTKQIAQLKSEDAAKEVRLRRRVSLSLAVVFAADLTPSWPDAGPHPPPGPFPGRGPRDAGGRRDRARLEAAGARARQAQVWRARRRRVHARAGWPDVGRPRVRLASALARSGHAVRWVVVDAGVRAPRLARLSRRRRARDAWPAREGRRRPPAVVPRHGHAGAQARPVRGAPSVVARHALLGRSDAVDGLARAGRPRRRQTLGSDGRRVARPRPVGLDRRGRLGPVRSSEHVARAVVRPSAVRGALVRVQRDAPPGLLQPLGTRFFERSQDRQHRQRVVLGRRRTDPAPLARQLDARASQAPVAGPPVPVRRRRRRRPARGHRRRARQGERSATGAPARVEPCLATSLQPGGPSLAFSLPTDRPSSSLPLSSAMYPRPPAPRAVVSLPFTTLLRSYVPATTPLLYDLTLPRQPSCLSPLPIRMLAPSVPASVSVPHTHGPPAVSVIVRDDDDDDDDERTRRPRSFAQRDRRRS